MFQIRRAVARALASSTNQIVTKRASIRPFRNSSNQQFISIRPFSQFQPRLAEENEKSEYSSQEIAATSESTDQVPEDAAPATSGEGEGQTSTGVDATASFEAASVPEAPVPRHSVYVGNISFSTNKEELLSVFNDYGQVVNVHFPLGPEGRPKGFAFLDFEDADTCAKVISELNGFEFNGRTLRVDQTIEKPRGPRGPREERGDQARPPRRGMGHEADNTPSKTLFIGNLSFQMSDRDLSNLFKGVKNAVDVRVSIDSRTGQPRGFAHADFTDIEAAEVALNKLNGTELYGRQIRVAFARENNNRTPRPSE